jgi:hypothetical protein
MTTTLFERVFPDRKEAVQWLYQRERWLWIHYVGENFNALREYMDEIKRAYVDYITPVPTNAAPERESPSRGDLNKRPADNQQKEMFNMPTERAEPDKINAPFVKINRVGQSVAGKVVRYGENDNGPFFVLEPAFAREAIGEKWQKHTTFAIGLSAGIVRKVKGAEDVGKHLLFVFHDTEAVDRGTKKLFKVFTLDSAEVLKLETEAEDHIAERAAKEQASGRMEPVFRETSKPDAAGADSYL